MPPDLAFPRPVKMSGTAEDAPQTPGMKATGPVPVTPERETVPVAVAPAAEQPVNPGLTPAAPAGSRK